MANINVDLTIRDNVTGLYYRTPVLPSEIAYSFGDAIADSVKIIDLGNVEFPSGRDLDTFAWQSFFPARYDAGYCTTSELLTPLEYQHLFQSWKDNATSLQLICPAAGINANMTLNSFKPVLRGHEGDIYYQVNFKERRVIKPVQVPITATVIAAQPKITADSRNPVPKKGKPSTYTVKSGDTLQTIAKRYGVNPWNTLLTKNVVLRGLNPTKPPIGTVIRI